MALNTTPNKLHQCDSLSYTDASKDTFTDKDRIDRVTQLILTCAYRKGDLGVKREFMITSSK